MSLSTAFSLPAIREMKQTGGVKSPIGAFVGPPTSNIAITNNSIVDVASWATDPAIFLVGVTNLKIEGNTIGPTFLGRGVALGKVTNVTFRNNHITEVGMTGFDVYDVVNGDISFNRFDRFYGTHAAGMAIYDNNAAWNENVTVANNQFDALSQPITFAGNNYSPPPVGNITIKNNVITNTTATSIASWGRQMNTVTIKGNIALGAGPTNFGLVLNRALHNITAQDNLLDGIGLGSASIPADWKIVNNTLLRQNNPGYNRVPPGNAINLGFRSAVVTALATPGELPAAICDVVAPGVTTKTYIGIDYFCAPRER